MEQLLSDIDFFKLLLIKFLSIFLPNTLIFLYHSVSAKYLSGRHINGASARDGVVD